MRHRAFPGIVAALVLAAVSVSGPITASATTGSASASLSAAQQRALYQIAKDTWRFYAADVDPNTHLPLDNITYAGGSPVPTFYGRYTSAANIGVYLWAVVAARDLGLINHHQASTQISATLSEVARLKRDHGFLYQWYDTTTGNVLLNPGESDCSVETTPAFDNCFFISNVDNGWYASGLIVVRNALPNLRHQVDQLMAPMDFSLFYDARPQTHCNTNPAVPGNQPTGQMFGGYYVGLPPEVGQNWTHYYHNGAFYSDPRISAYIGMGLHQMPGDVWWRSWRVLPPKAPFPDCQVTDPDFSWQGQWPHGGYWTVYRDPQSGKAFNVWEGHYTYPDTSLTFIPSFAGGVFEGLMANLVVPETKYGMRNFGLADVRYPQVAIKYTNEQLHLPVWGMSPSSTADDSGGYGGFGVEGLLFPYFGFGADANHPSKGLSQCHGCATEDIVTPHASFISLDVAPQEAYANIQKLRQLYPDIYRANGGFFDAVNPTTHQVGHRDLVLDQSMIMAALDNALRGDAMQDHFARDPVFKVDRLYLSLETFSIG